HLKALFVARWTVSTFHVSLIESTRLQPSSVMSQVNLQRPRHFTTLLNPEAEVHENNFLCQNCFRRLREDVENIREQSGSPLDSFQTVEETVEGINAIIGVPSVVSPLRPPSTLRKRLRMSYAKRKEVEITTALSPDKCDSCMSWEKNLRLAYGKCTSFQERCQVLTLLPPHLTVKDVQGFIPEATKYVIQKAKKLTDAGGVWSSLEPYSRCKLIKKTLTAAAFIKELQKTVMNWIPHNYLRRVQAKAIHDEKQSYERGALVFHFDFAENWTVVLADEVQAYHWQKKQISIFMCVVTSRKSTRSYAAACDDLTHDSAHACLA
ncbi:hypothetical protein HPB47_014240, partial [Ixodes persulcatus]